MSKKNEDNIQSASFGIQLGIERSNDESVAETQSHVGLTWNKVYPVANQ